MGLWKHQHDALEYMHSRKSALLLMGVATGKTLTTLEFLWQKDYHLTLIVATKNSLDVWQNEVDKQGYNFDVLTPKEGLVKDKVKQIKIHLQTHKSRTIIVINYEAMIRKPMLDVLLKIPFDCIVFDEVHRLRGHSTKQSKSAYQLAKAHPNAYRIGLTGTLIYNHPLDVFGIFRYIDSGVFGVQWNAFKETYAVWTGQFGQIPVRYINQDQLKLHVEQNSFIVDRHAVLDLPSEQHITLELELDKAQQKVYNEFNKEYVSAISEQTIIANNVLDKVNKLQQMTGGFIYQDGLTVPFNTVKINALTELLEEVQDHVVVFYKYKAELEILRSAAKAKSIPFYSIGGGQSDYGAWLIEPDPSLLAVQIVSGSEGIDFTKASIVVFYDMLYTSGQYEQALGRISRPNQKSSHVLYYYLVIKHTIDIQINKALKEGKDLIDYIISNRNTQ